MIRINLLQTSRSRKVGGQWDVHAEATAAAVLVVFVFVGCFYYSGVLEDEIQLKNLEKRQKRNQINVLNSKLKKVEDFEKKKKLLEDKNRIIEQLEKRRGGPVKVLDQISQGLDPLKLWLTRVSLKGKKVTLEGRALENDDVVAFVNNLRRGDIFDDINLGVIRSKLEHKVKIFEFTLNLKVK